jgi:Mg2+ and Co2+ transporter CorA
MHPLPLFRSTGRLFASHNIQLSCTKRTIGNIPRRASLSSGFWYSTGSSAARRRRAANDYLGNPRWEPGLEPGLDPARSAGGSTGDLLNSECHITVIDYSKDRIETQHLDNGSLTKWIETDGKIADWAKCRWINVDGLSWDVIQALGTYKNLHKLAIEDLVNTENRTKADW